MTPDLVDAVLEGAGKLAGEVLAPLNRIGDVDGSVLENGVVRTPRASSEAYAQYVEGGWNAIPFAAEHGGQGLPQALATAVARDVVERQHGVRALPDAHHRARSSCWPAYGIGRAEAALPRASWSAANGPAR